MTDDYRSGYAQALADVRQFLDSSLTETSDAMHGGPLELPTLDQRRSLVARVSALREIRAWVRAKAGKG